MSEEGDKWRNLTLRWELIVGLLGIIVTVLLAISSNDFSISVDPMIVNDVKQGGTASTQTKIDFGLLYDEDVSLRTETIPGIDIRFEPDLITDKDKCVSKGIISVSEDVPAKKHLISIVGTGSDGEQHNCTLELTVVSTKGSISIMSPTGASVYLDGMDKGKTPIDLDNIEQGQHTVTLRLEGYEDWSQTISVETGKTTPILPTNMTHVPTTGNISISSSPEEAKVYIDDTHQGETPTVLKNIEQGVHEINLKLEGYKDCTEIINVDVGETTKVLAELKPIQTEETSTETSTETLTGTGTSIETPEITIDSTSNTVDIKEDMSGIAKNIPEGDEIWIFVHPHTVNKYYPERSSAVIQNGEWSLSVGIGSENDAGKEFDIIVVLADTNAQEEINTYFAECEKTGEWPGMDNIPDSAKEYDRIAVTRLSVTPEIKIIYPSNGAQVDITESVNGEYKNIPEDKALWIVVFPHKSNNYHPVQEVPTDGDTSDFSVTVTLGRQESVGEKFDIIAMLADETAQEKFTNYLKTAADNNWQGIDLPDGTEEYSRITVTRK